ncbi:MAG: hypothetical protein U1F87_04290 [Kiritimatiellia bacterium]
MNIRTTSAVLALTVMGGLNVAAAEEGFKPSFLAGTDFSTAYIFRGATLHDKPVAQPYLYADPVEGLTVGAWGNVLLDDGSAGDAVDVNEVDLYAEYDLPTGDCPVGVSLAYTEYTCPNTVTGEGTVEDPRARCLRTASSACCSPCRTARPTPPSRPSTGSTGRSTRGPLYSELGISHSFEGVWRRGSPLAGRDRGLCRSGLRRERLPTTPP